MRKPYDRCPKQRKQPVKYAQDEYLQKLGTFTTTTSYLSRLSLEAYLIRYHKNTTLHPKVCYPGIL